MLSAILDGKDEGMLLRGWRHGWPGHHQCMPVRQVIILRNQITAFNSLDRPMYHEMRSALYGGAPGYQAPKANNGLYPSKQVHLHRNAIVSHSERWKLQLVLLFASWRIDTVSTPNVLTPTTRRWAEAHGKPWSRNLKTEIMGVSLDGTNFGYPAFRCMSGRQNGHATVP